MATKGAALRKQTGGSWARGQNRDPRRWFGNMLINSLLFLPSGGEGKFPSLRVWADLSESLLMDRIKCKWRRASSRTGGSRPPCREGSKQSRPGWPQPQPKTTLPSRLKRNFWLTAPSYLLRRTWIRGFAYKRWSERTSSGLSIGQGKLVFTKSLLFLPACNKFLKPPKYFTSSPAQNISYTHVLFLFLNLSCMWGLYLMYVGFPYIYMY